MQLISFRKTNCATQGIETCPMDSAIHLLNNWDLNEGRNQISILSSVGVHFMKVAV